MPRVMADVTCSQSDPRNLGIPLRPATVHVSSMDARLAWVPISPNVGSRHSKWRSTLSSGENHVLLRFLPEAELGGNYVVDGFNVVADLNRMASFRPFE
jgi:hypothetical protein